MARAVEASLAVAELAPGVGAGRAEGEQLAVVRPDHDRRTPAGRIRVGQRLAPRDPGRGPEVGRLARRPRAGAPRARVGGGLEAAARQRRHRGGDGGEQGRQPQHVSEQRAPAELTIRDAARGARSRARPPPPAGAPVSGGRARPGSWAAPRPRSARAAARRRRTRCPTRGSKGSCARSPSGTAPGSAPARQPRRSSSGTRAAPARRSRSRGPRQPLPPAPGATGPARAAGRPACRPRSRGAGSRCRSEPPNAGSRDRSASGCPRRRRCRRGTAGAAGGLSRDSPSPRLRARARIGSLPVGVCARRPSGPATARRPGAPARA